MTVVERTRVGEKGALRGRGLGPWTEAEILREELGGMRDFLDVSDSEVGISR